MSKKGQIYLAGLAMYLIAALSGYVLDMYWLVLIAALLVVEFTAYRVFKTDKEELYDSTKFDWISIFALAGSTLILFVCFTVLKVPATGIIGYFHVLVQALGYLLIGYSVIRYTWENTSFYKGAFKKKEQNKEVIISETTTTETTTKVAEEIKETIKEETPEYSTVEVVEETPEPEIKSIEFKVEEKVELETPYMEEEI